METKWRWLFVTAIAPISWGATYYVTQETLPADQPVWGAFIRAFPAAVILLLLARRLPTGAWWWRSFVLGALNIGSFFVLVYMAAQLLPASVASTISATSAGVMLVLAWPLLGQRPTWGPLFGAVVGFIGVVVMLSPSGEGVDGWGVAFSFAAMVSSTFGFLLARRWGGEVPILASTAWQLFAGSVLLAPFALIVEGTPHPVTAQSFWGFAYITLIATALAFMSWFTGLKHLPAGVVGVVGLLNPVTGVLMGTLLLGESLGVGRIIGIVLVLTGVLVGSLSQNRRKRPSRVAPNPADPNPAPEPAA